MACGFGVLAWLESTPGRWRWPLVALVFLVSIVATAAIPAPYLIGQAHWSFGPFGWLVVLLTLDLGAHPLVVLLVAHYLVTLVQVVVVDDHPAIAAGALGTDTRGQRPKLTPREVHVLIEWFHCESKEMVTRKLSLSVRTVNSYIDRVRGKVRQRRARGPHQGGAGGAGAAGRAGRRE